MEWRQVVVDQAMTKTRQPTTPILLSNVLVVKVTRSFVASKNRRASDATGNQPYLMISYLAQDRQGLENTVLNQQRTLVGSCGQLVDRLGTLSPNHHYFSSLFIDSAL